jgi:hypothetical protein
MLFLDKSNMLRSDHIKTPPRSTHRHKARKTLLILFFAVWFVGAALLMYFAYK